MLSKEIPKWGDRAQNRLREFLSIENDRDGNPYFREEALVAIGLSTAKNEVFNV